MKKWSRKIEIAGEKVTITFIQRPFREGLEVKAEHPQLGEFHLAELGLGEQAAIEQLKSQIMAKIKAK